MVNSDPKPMLSLVSFDENRAAELVRVARQVMRTLGEGGHAEQQERGAAAETWRGRFADEFEARSSTADTESARLTERLAEMIAQVERAADAAAAENAGRRRSHEKALTEWSQRRESTLGSTP